MYYFTIIILVALQSLQSRCFEIYENDLNIRVEAGSKTCIFQSGNAGQAMEVYYQVLDGQHGELDISFDVTDPNGKKLVTDYKRPENSIIMDLETDGDYAFCLDNTYSRFNSKLVFVYILIEDKESEKVEQNETVAVVDEDGAEQKEEEILEWTSTDENGEIYYIEVKQVTESLSRTLKHVLKARHMLDIYGATKSRDSYLAFEDTFIVDVWSGFQITLMFIVGMVQVYMIKKLFSSPFKGYKSVY